MRAKVIDKGEGFIVVRMEATSPAESMILSTVALQDLDTVSCALESTVDWSKTIPATIPKVTIGGMSLQTHDLVK
jgi:hypothetical protein